MSFLQLAFWISFACLVHTYVGYGFLLLIIASIKQTLRDLLFLLGRAERRRQTGEPSELPRVGLLVAAHNEAAVIGEKLRNTAALEYPAGRLEFLLGLDSPSDKTPEIAHSAGNGVRVFEFGQRRGKLAVIRDLATRTQADVLFFSDANTLLQPNCLRRIAGHFEDPRVGAVCGELRVVAPGGKKEMESAYWRYEVALKFLENRLNCVLGANGAIYAVRRSLFDLQGNWIVEDFQLPMQIRYNGHRVVYDPEAVGTEEAAPDFAAEFRRKVRIGAGAFQTLFRNPRFLNPMKGFLTFAYVSHKVLRWLGPFFLITMLLTSTSLAFQKSLMFAVVTATQLAFYVLALAGHGVRSSSPMQGPWFSIPRYFVGMNLALFFGFFRFLFGSQKAVWSSTPRPSVATAPLSDGEKH